MMYWTLKTTVNQKHNFYAKMTIIKEQRVQSYSWKLIERIKPETLR